MAQSLTPEIISTAIDGLTAKQQAIGLQIAELRAMLPGASSDGNTSVTGNTAPAGRRGGKRVISAEARKRMAEAQRRRWATAEGESQPAASAPAAAPTKKRKLSPDGRRAIVAALKKRWAAKRAAAKKSSKGAR
jgi:hypothetical protein